MLPTSLTVWLVALGLLGSLAGVGYSLLADPDPSVATTIHLGVFAYDLGILLLLVLDAARTRRRWALTVRRELPARLSVGTANPVTLLVENRGNRTMRVVIRDEAPATFRAEPPLLEVEVPPHTWVRVPYQVVPTERGDFAFGDVQVRARGALGLALVDKSLPARQRVQVYPNLLAVRRYEA